MLLHKLSHLDGVFLRVVMVRCGVTNSWDYPEFFFALFCFVEWVDHLSWNIGVGIAVNEEHGTAAFGYLLQGTGLSETPAVQHLAEKRGGVKNWSTSPEKIVTKYVYNLSWSW
mgnify:CR=1 FL=1